MAKSIKSSKNVRLYEEHSCGTSDKMSATDILATNFIGEKIKSNIEKRNNILKAAKEERLSNRSSAGAPYITHSETRDGDTYTYIPVIFHVFEPSPEFNMSEYFPGFQAGVTITLMNQMLAGLNGNTQLNYTGYHTGYADSKIKDWLENYQSAEITTAFTSPLYHPDHGVESSFKFKIPNKIKKSEILNATNVFDAEKVNSMFSASEYLMGGEYGVMFRYPYDVWTKNEELKQIALGGNPKSNHSLLDSISSLNVIITDVDSKPNYGGVAVFPTSETNFHCSINGANVHHRPFALAEVLLHEIGHCFLLKHTHGNPAFKEQDGEFYLGPYNLTDVDTLEAGTQLADGVGFSPPRYLNNDGESIYDLDPLSNTDKSYIEFVFKEQAKLVYSLYPSMEYYLVSNSAHLHEVSNNYFDDLYDDFNPFIEHDKEFLRNQVVNTDVRYFTYLLTAQLCGQISYTYMHNQISAMFNAASISGLPFWGGSQAYDPVKGENVIVLNPVGNSEKSVGNIYDSTIGNVSTISFESLAPSNGGVFFYVDEENQLAYVFETTLHGPLNHADALEYAENYTGGGFTDWSLPTSEQLIAIAENTNIFDDRQFASNGRIWTNAVTDDIMGYSGAFFMHPEGFWTGTAGQPGAWQYFNVWPSTYEVDFILVRSFSIESVTVRRGPSVDGEAINRIPFCVLDEDGNQTTEYDPLWSRYKNQFNPAYPAYPNNYPLTEWANLSSDLCPCISAEQTITIDGGTEAIIYYPKTVGDEDLIKVYVQSLSNRFDIPYTEAEYMFKTLEVLDVTSLTAKSSVLGSLNLESSYMMTWRYDNGDTRYPIGLFYYGFDVNYYHKGYKYESNPDIGLHLPSINDQEGIDVFTGALFYETGMPDLRRSAQIGAGTRQLGIQEFAFADLHSLISYSRDDFFIGPYTDVYGNTVTINLKNPLKEHYGLNLKSYRRDDDFSMFNPDPTSLGYAHTFWSPLGDDMFNTYPEIHNTVYQDYPSFFVPQFNYPGNFKGARKWGSMSSSADNFFHPEGIINGFKYGTDDTNGITYRDITNVMQYPPVLYNSSLDDHTTDDLHFDMLSADEDVSEVTPANYIELLTKFKIKNEASMFVYNNFYKETKDAQLEAVELAGYPTNYISVAAGNVEPGSSLYNSLYGYSVPFDIAAHGKNYSFLNTKFPAQGSNDNPPTTVPELYGEFALVSRSGYRCSYSPDQIFYIESLLEYCDNISYEEVDGFSGQFTGFQYGEYSNADSAYNVLKGVKDLLEVSKDLNLNNNTFYSNAPSEIDYLMTGKDTTVNLCNGQIQTVQSLGTVKVDIDTSRVDNSSSSLDRNISFRNRPESEVELELTPIEEPDTSYTISNLYTYGNTLYRLDGSEYIGHYHVHSVNGPMEGPTHIEQAHSKLKYYYQLDPLGVSYKNKTRRANNFNRIYKSISKIL